MLGTNMILSMNRAAPTLVEVRHVKLCYGKDRYCGHPRQLPFRNFGGGELVVAHFHAPATYQTRDTITHGLGHYMGRASVLLQRSYDSGETWLPENEGVVWDHSRPLAERLEVLHRADVPAIGREVIDLTSPDALVYFGRHAISPASGDGEPTLECFAFRSGDRGHTWETVPTRVSPPPGFNFASIDSAPLTVLSDGTAVMPAWVDNRNTGGDRGYVGAIIGLYGSDDNGLSWQYLAEVANDPTGRGRPGYANLLLLPSGRLQCYLNQIGGIRHALAMNYSDDGGYSWSQPHPLVAWGHSPWASLTRDHAWSGARRQGVPYRSPWPLRLRDGRIVVIFGRRHPPFGMGLIVSDDDGATWSTEAVIRADASEGDLGYPVATELDDGRIFTAYYYTEEDGNNFGGTRYIAASIFRLE
ncbi:MAG: hypothetical protein CMJ87_08610 [Planctomycetes bacterium]|nr:hypothetical protein [Planctomycetota bacterium]